MELATPGNRIYDCKRRSLVARLSRVIDRNVRVASRVAARSTPSRHKNEGSASVPGSWATGLFTADPRKGDWWTAAPLIIFIVSSMNCDIPLRRGTVIASFPLFVATGSRSLPAHRDRSVSC